MVPDIKIVVSHEERGVFMARIGLKTVSGLCIMSSFLQVCSQSENSQNCSLMGTFYVYYASITFTFFFKQGGGEKEISLSGNKT